MGGYSSFVLALIVNLLGMWVGWRMAKDGMTGPQAIASVCVGLAIVAIGHVLIGYL